VTKRCSAARALSLLQISILGSARSNLTGDIQGSQLGRAAKTASKQLLKKELETDKRIVRAEHPDRIDSQGQRIYI
jgi:hypothetical protein